MHMLSFPVVSPGMILTVPLPGTNAWGLDMTMALPLPSDLTGNDIDHAPARDKRSGLDMTVALPFAPDDLKQP